jgi:hypothetical protein
VADLVLVAGFLAVLGFLLYEQWRDLAPSLFEKPTPPQELLARRRRSPYGVDHDWPWPETTNRTANRR